MGNGLDAGEFIEVVSSLSHVHLLTAVISAVVVAGIFACHWFAAKMPAPLIAVVLAIASSKIWDFAGRGVAIVGPVAGGWPHLGPPDVHWHDVLPLIGLSGSCFVMIVAQSAATARFYAVRHQQQLKEDSDLLGLGAANIAAAFSGTFVVNGSPTQTAMVESSGGSSQLAQVFTSVIVAVVLLFLTRPLQDLPRCVLGAIVFFIAVRLVDLGALRDIWRESPSEFRLALITATIVVFVGVEEGIILAMVLSLLRVVKHGYRPHTGVLVAGDSGIWRTTPPVEGSVTEPGLAIYRFGAAIFYANVGRFTEEIRNIVGSRSKVRWLVVDAEAITNVDYTAARMIRELHPELSRKGVVLAFARADHSLHADLVRHRLIDVINDLTRGPHRKTLASSVWAVPLWISISNRGPDAAPIQMLPTLWFRNTWSWGRDDRRPSITAADAPAASKLRRAVARQWALGEYVLYCAEADELLFTENETNNERIFGTVSSSPYVKDAFHECVINGKREAVNPSGTGTKAAARYARTVDAGATITLQLRLAAAIDKQLLEDPFADFDALLINCNEEADEFYDVVLPKALSSDAKLVAR